MKFTHPIDSCGSAEAPPANGYRFLGSLRLILALIVVVSHSRLLGGDQIAEALKPWGMGNIGVMGFFILSGYIIAEAKDVFYRNRAKDFLANRAMRLVPPYVVALVFSVAAHWYLVSYSTPKYFDYAQTPDGMFGIKNIVGNVILPFVWYGLDSIGIEPVYPFVRYVWAVSVEWLFYIIYAIGFWISFSRGRVAAVVLYIIFSLSSAMYKITSVVWFYPLTFAPYFLLGVCLYYRKLGSFLPKAGIFISIIMCAVHFYFYAGATAQAAIAALITVLSGLAIIPLSGFRLSKRMRHYDRLLGDLSYPIYLNHYLITVLFLSLCQSRSWGVMFWCVIVTVAFSWCMSKIVEPFTRGVRDRLRGASLD